MSDVVVGALIGAVAVGFGAVLQGLINHKLQIGSEKRRDVLDRGQAIVAGRLRALDQAHRMLVVGAEFARASALGEDPEQVARLRSQAESSNYLEADVTLVGNPAIVATFIERSMWWLGQPKGTKVSSTEISVDAELANRLQAAFRVARERVIGEPMAV